MSLNSSLESLSQHVFPLPCSSIDSEEDTDNGSLKLQSLPASFNFDSSKTFKYNQMMTMKQIDGELNSLRRENFDLKLQLYLEKKNKTPTRNGFELINSKEKERLSNIEQHYEHLLRVKQMEIDELQSERDALNSDLSMATSICRSFMSHFHDLKDFWNQSKSSLNRDLMISINYWLNLSEDLLNSASVLIPDDPKYRQKESIKLSNQAEVNNPINKETQEYLRYKELLYKSSSDSEDEWSEPDRNVSRARIGYKFEQVVPQQPPRAPPKTKNRRLNSLQSVPGTSLGILSELGRLGLRKPKIDDECQTNLTNEDINLFLIRNKETRESATQTYQLFNNRSTQTSSCSSDIDTKSLFDHRSKVNEEQEKNKTLDHLTAFNIIQNKCSENSIKYSSVRKEFQNNTPPNKSYESKGDGRMFDFSSSSSSTSSSCRPIRRRSELLHSPDLGLGESECDLTGLAYINIGQYNMLLSNLSKMSIIMCELDSLDSSFEEINELIESCIQICRQFRLENEELLMSLERMKLRKESMERAITKQLKKTDDLLNKARINLQIF